MIGHIWHDRYYMLAFILKQNKPLQVVLKLDQGLGLRGLRFREGVSSQRGLVWQGLGFV